MCQLEPTRSKINKEMFILISDLSSLYSTIIQNTMSWAFGNKTVFQEMQISS
jgi:hypothetical protein